MVDVPTRTLLDYLNSLPSGGVGGAVTRDLTIRDDLATGQQAVPPGGSTGEVLVKLGDGDFDTGWAPAGQGTVQTITVDTANGFAGASDGDPSNPTLTLSTTVTGLLKGNGTAISAATGGTDYLVPGGNLGTPSAGVLTNATGLPIVGGTTGTLPETRGGTNQTSYAQGDMLYASATNTLSKLSKGSAFQNLRMNSAAAIPEWALAREVLAANRTYYVRTDGSNSNNGLTNSAGGAFLTIQHAYDTCLRLDFNGYSVTISVQSGTYTAGLTIGSAWLGGTLTIDLSAGAHINLASGSCITANALGGRLFIKGGKLSAASGSGIVVATPGTVTHEGVEFGTCSGFHLAAQVPGATLASSTNYTISGGGSGHILAGNLAYVYVTNATITITGTPAFTRFASADTLAYVRLTGNTYSGTATGSQYLSNRLSYILLAGATLPGDSAGTTSNGGMAA